MYLGLAKMVGMKVLESGRGFDDELHTLERHFGDYDFFFLHYKPADTAGEDGDFDAKVARLEELDAAIPQAPQPGRGRSRRRRRPLDPRGDGRPQLAPGAAWPYTRRSP